MQWYTETNYKLPSILEVRCYGDCTEFQTDCATADNMSQLPEIVHDISSTLDIQNNITFETASAPHFAHRYGESQPVQCCHILTWPSLQIYPCQSSHMYKIRLDWEKTVSK